MGMSGVKVRMGLQMDMPYQSTFIKLQAKPGWQWEQKLAPEDTKRPVKILADIDPREEDIQYTTSSKL